MFVEFTALHGRVALLMQKSHITAVQDCNGWCRVSTNRTDFQVAESYADVWRILGLNDDL